MIWPAPGDYRNYVVDGRTFWYWYFPKTSKIALIVKPEYESKSAKIFDNKKSPSEQRPYRCCYWKSNVLKRIHQRNSKLRNELLLISVIAEIQPQAAYSLYVHRFKSKFNLFDCTILTIQSHMKGIEEFWESVLFLLSSVNHQFLNVYDIPYLYLYTTWINGSNNTLSKCRGRT